MSSTRRPTSVHRSLLKAVACVVVLFVSVTLRAGNDDLKKIFDLTAGTAENSLKQFSEQSGVGVIFVTDAVKGIETNAVRGEFTVREALQMLLKDTPLVVTEDEKTGAFAVRRERPEESKNGGSRPPLGGTAAGLSLAPSTVPAAGDEGPLLLSPFTVDASQDRGSYMANSTLAGTRVRTDLKDVASAISVVTAQFLQDTGVKNQDDLLVYTPSTEVSGLRGNFSGAGGGPNFTENTISSTTRVRGLDQADNTRDYFLTDIPWDSFDVGRIDLQRGPNSILFGVGSPAGIINASTNDASFNNAYSVENRVDQYGSLRDSFNLNQELIPGVLAVRVAGLIDDEKYEQNPAYNNQTRYYGAFRFDPKLFGPESHTSIRGTLEEGHVRSDNPRDLPPTDAITPWFATGTDAYGNPGLNKLTTNQFSLSNPNPSGVALPGATTSVLADATFELGGNAETRSFWPDVLNYYEVTPVSINTTAGALNPTGTPIETITAEANQGLAPGAAIAGIPTYRPQAIPSYSGYADNVGNVAGYPGAPIPGGVYYTDKVITDPSIFNFYKLLLDGPNKHEWKDWKAFNLAVDQSFFDNRFAFEVAYDQQKYDQGESGGLTGGYEISIDVNQTYADGTPNPNVGRPYVGNGESLDNNETTTDRQTIRFTPSLELRSSDFFGNGLLAEILGKSNVTGLYERNSVVTNTMTWAEYATTPGYVTDNSTAVNAANSLGANRDFDFIAYIGPSLLKASSASGANLSNLNYVVAPPEYEQVRNFNSTWNVPTDPSAPGYVNPTAPYSYVSNVSGATTQSTQANNPANYVGWSNEQIQWMSASNPADFPSLVETAGRSRYSDESKGITWQGYLFGGDLVPALGWRQDRITSYDTQAATDPNSGFTSLNFPDNLNSRTDVRGTSKTWGGVYHFPKSWMSRLPYETTFSLLFNRSENFQADAQRESLTGEPLPNPAGTTTEAGFVVTSLSDKISLKVDWFKTLVKNATLGDQSATTEIGGLGPNAYYIVYESAWGYAWAANLQDGLRGQSQPGGGPGAYWDYGAGSGYVPGSPQYIATNAYSQQIVDAWLNAPFPATFFPSYGLQPAIDPSLGHASGNLRDSFPGGYADANGPVTGGDGSAAGDHVTTVDNLSKGVEIELTAQPTRNWNLTLNYTHTNATHENIDPAAQAFIGALAKFYNGPGGQIRQWYNAGPTIGSSIDQGVIAPFTVQLNDLGHEAPEVSPWRLNLVSTYSFERGMIKGVFIGGAVRDEDGRILGYKYDPTFKNVNASDPNYAAVPGITLGGLNVNEPFRGSDDFHVDAWIGYSRKLYRSVNWRIELNIKSVGEKDKLVPATIEPDGSLGLARIQEGMGWQVTNTFDF